MSRDVLYESCRSAIVAVYEIVRIAEVVSIALDMNLTKSHSERSEKGNQGISPIPIV
jgi:hypothetical protein